ncbi:MAG: DUF4825 domain-containing protein [Lachnospiraceae bacterium]|nr:DUF4825 domain-containing protein [Lachnospiraceae bacterium]
MNKIPCETIQDLLPSYIDGLTSPTTNGLIEEHTEGCPACAKALAAMRGEAGMEPPTNALDKKEIDFLKKTRTMQKIAFFSSMAAIVLAALFVLLRIFVVGSSYDGAFCMIDEISVENGELRLKASTMDSINVISRMRFTEENGTVSIRVNVVPAGIFARPGKEFRYAVSDPSALKEVRIGKQLIWEEGESIPALASTVYASRHDYIGDMPANQKSANALSLSTRIGEYENELETAQEPYGWTIRLKNDISSADAVLRESDMESSAYVLIGVISNLDHVCFEYTVDGSSRSLTFSAADASDFLGRDIKDCGRSARVLSELIEKTGF